MKHRSRRILSILLSLALVPGLMSGMSLTAYAGTLDGSSTTWTENSTIADDVIIISGVTVTDDITLTIPEGKTLTVNGGINAEGKTLTVAGAGTLTVNGANGSDGAEGCDGGSGYTGILIVDGANVNLTGGNGSDGSDDGSGGNGGAGVTGSVTVQSGSVTIAGGSDGDGDGSGIAVTGTIASTSTAEESDDNSTWTAIADTVSTKRYVRAEGSSHTHSFAYSVSGATITANCGEDNCTLTSAPTLTIVKPTLTTVGGTGDAAASLDGMEAFNTATGESIAETDITYVGRDGTTYEESATAPIVEGKYIAQLTLSGVRTSEGEDKSVTASVDYEILVPVTSVASDSSAAQTMDVDENGTAGKKVGTDAPVTATSDADSDADGDADGEPATVAVTGVTISPNTDQTIEIGGKVSFTASIEPDAATDKKVKWSVDGSNPGAVTLYTDEACTAGHEVGADATSSLIVYAKAITAGSAIVYCTSNDNSDLYAYCNVRVLSTYIVTIPATLDVTQAGWNSSSGISATGSLASSYSLSVTAASENNWALKQQDGSETVSYTMKSASTDTEAVTSWSFSTLSSTAATKSMGIDVEDYSTKPVGTYQDTVTFTATLIDDFCVTEGTLITLADGTQAPIETLKVGDLVQTWSFWNGRYEAQPVTVVINHGVDEYTVHSLVFSDGAVVETINGHGFYSSDFNDYVFITPENVDEYLGRHFVLRSKDGGNETVTLVESQTEVRKVGCYSLLTAHNYNFMTENMLSITMEYCPGCFHFFDIGDNMAYDPDKMAQDIARYGLYTADDFSEYVTAEQFDMLNGPYYKVLVGRGTLSEGDIIKMIGTYIPARTK